MKEQQRNIKLKMLFIFTKFCLNNNLSATDVTLANSSGIDALYLLHVHSVCMVLKCGIIHLHVFT